MSIFKWFTAFALASTMIVSAQAEAHCPGNVASLRFRLSSRSQIIVPVTFSHAGPYDFLVDTGSQFTMLDRTLASELHLEPQGSAKLVGVGFSANASFAQVHSLEVGPHLIENEVVELVDLEKHESASLHIRGILGGHSLAQFDVLMDYPRRLLCLDDSKAMQTAVKGTHIELVTPVASLSSLVIIPMRLSGSGSRQLHLALDSGTNVPILFDPHQYLSAELPQSAPVLRRGNDGVMREFFVLRSQHMQIGSLNLDQVSFVMPEHSDGNVLEAAVDGLLSTALFRTVFISYVDHFVVLNPQ
jgi:hypothetical protein